VLIEEEGILSKTNLRTKLTYALVEYVITNIKFNYMPRSTSIYYSFIFLIVYYTIRSFIDIRYNAS